MRRSKDWWAMLNYRVRLQAYYMNSNQPHGVQSPVIVEHKPF